MSKLKKVLATFLVMCSLISTIFTSAADAASVYGNSNSNLANGGIAASRGNYSYSRSSKFQKKGYYEELKHYYIYKTYKNGTSKKVIADNASEEPYINVVGNYVYYVGYGKNSSDRAIYRAKTDGTSKTRLMSESYNFDHSIIVKDNYLYYINESQYHDSVSLRRYNLTTKTTDSIIYTTKTRDLYDMSISGDYIYLTAEGLNNTIIYKINTKTNKRTTLYTLTHDDEYGYYLIEDMIYYKGNIYFTIYDEDDDYLSFKMSSNGTNLELISEYYTTGINLYNDKIYYVNVKGSICSMNLDGTNRKTIKKFKNTEYPYYINTASSRIYFGKMVVYENSYNVVSDNMYRMTLSASSTIKM